MLLDHIRKGSKIFEWTIDYAIYYTDFPAILEDYSNVDWIIDSQETKSTSDYVFSLAGDAVS